MPRRDDEYMAAQRDRILDAALREFAARGFLGASMRDIARTAKLSPGTLYIHFRNKDALFRGIVAKRQAQFPELRSGDVDDVLSACQRSWSRPVDASTRRLNKVYARLSVDAAADRSVAKLVRRQADESLELFVAAVERDRRFAEWPPDSQRALGRRLLLWWSAVAQARADAPSGDDIEDLTWGFQALVARALTDMDARATRSTQRTRMPNGRSADAGDQA